MNGAWRRPRRELKPRIAGPAPAVRRHRDSPGSRMIGMAGCDPFSRLDRSDLATALGLGQATSRAVDLGLGVCLRLIVYARNRRFWHGRELACGATSTGCRSSISRSELTGDQLAPLGFLIVERALVAAAWATRYVGAACSARWPGSLRCSCSCRWPLQVAAAARGTGRTGRCLRARTT